MDTFNRAPPTAQVTLKQITAEKVDLYSYVLPPGANITISVVPSPVYDLVNTEEEIKWAVKGLQNHCSKGPSSIRAKHLKGWLAAAKIIYREEAEG